MVYIKSLFVVLLCLSVAFQYSEAKVSSGHVKGYEFVYLDKFCFGLGQGTLNYTITSKTNQTQPIYMLYVDDQDGNWTDIYKHKLTCAERMDKAGGGRGAREIYPDGRLGYTPFEDKQRQHFWYIALLSCGEHIDVKYEFTFLQESNSKWVQQFSFDEQGLEGLYLFYFIFFLLAIVVHGYTIWSFLQTGSYHLLVRIFTAAVVFEGLSVFCLFVHYAAYSSNGVGAPFLKGLGEFLDIVGQIIFILLIILIAKGWCISKTTIDDRIVVLVGLGVLVVLYITMFGWSLGGLDHASTLYVYQTAPGIIIIVVRAVAMLWFIYSMRNTYLEENNAAKRKFYLWFGVSFTIWFLALPFITSVAAGLDPWMRQKTVMGLYVTFNTVFLVILGALLWPSRASEYFQISSSSRFGSVPYDAI